MEDDIAAALASIFDSSKRIATPTSPAQQGSGGGGRKTSESGGWSHSWTASKDETAAKLLSVGDRVDVAGYWCPGTVRWVGIHKTDISKGWRVMVQLDKPIGKNNGTVGEGLRAVEYCDVLPSHTGALVSTKKVTKRTAEQEDDYVASMAKRTTSGRSFLAAPEGWRSPTVSPISSPTGSRRTSTASGGFGSPLKGSGASHTSLL